MAIQYKQSCREQTKQKLISEFDKLVDNGKVDAETIDIVIGMVMSIFKLAGLNT